MSRRMGDSLDASGTEIVRRRGDEPVIQTVVRAVAEARGTSTLALPPLADAVDPDALDALCTGQRASGRVAFDYAGHRVTVAAGGTVTVSGTGSEPRWPVAPADKQR